MRTDVCMYDIYVLYPPCSISSFLAAHDVPNDSNVCCIIAITIMIHHCLYLPCHTDTPLSIFTMPHRRYSDCRQFSRTAATPYHSYSVYRTYSAVVCTKWDDNTPTHDTNCCLYHTYGNKPSTFVMMMSHGVSNSTTVRVKTQPSDEYILGVNICI